MFWSCTRRCKTIRYTMRMSLTLQVAWTR